MDESVTDEMFRERDDEPVTGPLPPNPIVPPTRARGRPKRPSPPPAPPRAPAAKPKPKGKDRKDYKTPILGLGQLAAAPCLLAGQALRNPAFIADAAAVTMHTPPIAEAIDELANTDPQVAAVLDRLLVVGPYGAVLAASLPLAAQIVTNHNSKVLSVTQAFGSVDPEHLIATLVEEVSLNGDKESQPTSG